MATVTDTRPVIPAEAQPHFTMQLRLGLLLMTVAVLLAVVLGIFLRGQGSLGL